MKTTFGNLTAYKSAAPTWVKLAAIAVIYLLLKTFNDIENSPFYSYHEAWWFQIVFWYKAEIILGLMFLRDMFGTKEVPRVSEMETTDETQTS